MAKRRARAATVFSPPERLSMGRNLATRRDNKHINKYILILESALACIELFINTPLELINHISVKRAGLDVMQGG